MIEQLGAKEAHEAVMGDRNQHVAHRISDHEQLKVTGLLAPPPGEQEMVGVAIWGMRLVGRMPDEVEALRVLAGQLHDSIAGELSLLKARIVELSPDHLDDFYRDADRP